MIIKKIQENCGQLLRGMFSATTRKKKYQAQELVVKLTAE